MHNGYREYEKFGVHIPTPLLREVCALVGRTDTSVSTRGRAKKVHFVLEAYVTRYPAEVGVKPQPKGGDERPEGEQVTLTLDPYTEECLGRAMWRWRDDMADLEQGRRKASLRGMVLAACREAIATDCWGLVHSAQEGA